MELKTNLNLFLRKILDFKRYQQFRKQNDKKSSSSSLYFSAKDWVHLKCVQITSKVFLSIHGLYPIIIIYLMFTSSQMI